MRGLDTGTSWPLVFKMSSILLGLPLTTREKDQADVDEFLRDFPSHEFLLSRACEKAVEIYGEKVRSFRLEVERDYWPLEKCPECKYHRTTERRSLWVHIQTDADVDEALKLDQQYSDWYVDHLIDSNLQTNIEFIK